MSPTQRTLKVMREKEGATVAIVEKYNFFAKIRQDLFNMFDLLAIRGGEIIGVQVTSGAHHSARVQKIRANEIAPLWILAGGVIEVRTWAKKGPRGKAKKWVERIERIEV